MEPAMSGILIRRVSSQANDPRITRPFFGDKTMQATDLLQNEHRVIEQVLACLETMASECVAEGTLDVSAARQAIDFFRNFGDCCHHAKEERLLFPLMETRSLVGEHGPIDRMLYEHMIGRQYLDALATATDAASTGDQEALLRFAYRARDYSYWLRGHIVKEDQRLFPLANRALTEEDQAVLLRAFERAEAHERGTGTHEKYLKIADELAERFHVPRAGAEDPGAFTCTSCGLAFHA
jgi:hemerythrin-like domain-containing protein